MRKSSFTAIKEQELKFGYCSMCHRFRQVCCSINDEKVCADCTQARGINAIAPPPPPPQVKQKRVVNRKRYQPLFQLQSRLVECLRGRCLSSQELYQLCGKQHYTDYESFIWFLRNLHSNKIIFSCRWRANGHNYHVLSSEKDLLAQRIGKAPEERIIEVLKEVREMPVSKLARKISLSRATTYGVSKRLEKEGTVRLERSQDGQVIVSVIN
ncbi:MarR family transcriptional regulator [Scytonema sp. PCC 10023]|uniref:MarR family transcriptional regulator n=1 Tax=Scytonema sp. PCC 10023 TaxID=1680591 RepID=UPI0039C6F32F